LGFILTSSKVHRSPALQDSHGPNNHAHGIAPGQAPQYHHYSQYATAVLYFPFSFSVFISPPNQLMWTILFINLMSITLTNCYPYYQYY